MSKEKSYQPSPEEMKKAEEMMTMEQKLKSGGRELTHVMGESLEKALNKLSPKEREEYIKNFKKEQIFEGWEDPNS